MTGFAEVSQNEMMVVDGGDFWTILGCMAGGAAAGLALTGGAPAGGAIGALAGGLIGIGIVTYYEMK